MLCVYVVLLAREHEGAMKRRDDCEQTIAAQGYRQSRHAECVRACVFTTRSHPPYFHFRAEEGQERDFTLRILVLCCANAHARAHTRQF